MGVHTEIYWCDSSFNSHWGCLEVSPGCNNCYARTLSERLHRAEWGDPKETVRLVTSNTNWRQPLVWNARVAAKDTNWTSTWRKPVRENTLRRLVFSNSMSDVFEHTEQLDPVRTRLWNLIEQTPYLDWLLLTKRPQNIRRMLPQSWLQHPMPNVWLGTSTESQQWADLRIPHLLEVPATVHFLSAEPLIGPLNILRWIRFTLSREHSVNWVITGGESGANHRPLDIAWIRDIDRQCSDAEVPHFYKQFGGRTHAEGGCLLDGDEIKQFPATHVPELSAA